MQTVEVIIPALNEAGNIYRLVKAVQTLNISGVQLCVSVVDNGSTDDTALEAQAAGARLVSEPRQGYGYACAAGADAAKQANILVFLDGDFSSLPSELPRLLTPILNNQAELVQGSREQGNIAPGAMPLQQRLGNRLAVGLINALYGLKLSDLGPYRAIRRELLLELQMHEMTYGWPTEMTVKAARHGARLVEVPVCWERRQKGRSKVSGSLRGAALAAWFILGVTLRYAIWPAPYGRQS
jgi:glycosyltransferase involved in cell wall biosynthesis